MVVYALGFHQYYYKIISLRLPLPELLDVLPDQFLALRVALRLVPEHEQDLDENEVRRDEYLQDVVQQGRGPFYRTLKSLARLTFEDTVSDELQHPARDLHHDRTLQVAAPWVLHRLEQPLPHQLKAHVEQPRQQSTLRVDAHVHCTQKQDQRQGQRQLEGVQVDRERVVQQNLAQRKQDQRNANYVNAFISYISMRIYVHRVVVVAAICTKEFLEGRKDPHNFYKKITYGRTPKEERTARGGSTGETPDHRRVAGEGASNGKPEPAGWGLL